MPLQQVRTNLALDAWRQENERELRPDEVAAFVIALGKTIMRHQVTPNEIVGAISKEHFATMRFYMMQDGIDSVDVEPIYELCCGHLFGMWP